MTTSIGAYSVSASSVYLPPTNEFVMLKVEGITDWSEIRQGWLFQIGIPPLEKWRQEKRKREKAGRFKLIKSISKSLPGRKERKHRLYYKTYTTVSEYISTFKRRTKRARKAKILAKRIRLKKEQEKARASTPAKVSPSNTVISDPILDLLVLLLELLMTLMVFNLGVIFESFFL